MLNRFSFLSILGMFAFVALPNPVLADISLGIATDTQTHTSAIELKPASLEGSYQTASVCFLGDTKEECAQMGFNKGNEDYNVDTAKQCMNEGYIKNNCNSAQEPDTLCPYNSSYVKGCKCKTSLITCTSPKIGVGPSCSGKYASCTCPSTVSLSYPNDRCTQYCDGSCIAKTCSPNASESGCSYGTQSCSNGCGGTRSCCKPCYPYSDESGCSYGTYSCSNGCGGTRRCCSSCSPYSSETGCQYGTYSCSNGCGGTRTCCSAKPTPPANPWRYYQYAGSGNSFCSIHNGQYWAICGADMYCVNGGSKNYICQLSYAFGKNFRAEGSGGSGYSTMSECQAAGNRSCSSLISSGDKGACNSNGSSNCHY